MIDKIRLATLKNEAISILNRNSRGNFTKPAPRLYPHQWNWDSGFIAIGLSHYDREKAKKELLSLKRGQWRNGMIPHIIFDPRCADYQPGPSSWGCSKSLDSSENVLTSGITQPPILALAAYEIYKNSKNKISAKEFLNQIFPILKKYHRFFYLHRDPKHEGLACIVHPWESGLDNSPRWDKSLNRLPLKQFSSYKRVDTDVVPIEQRPGNDDYDKYYYLIQLLRKEKYNFDSIFERSEFIIQPILFNSLMVSSLHSLREIGKIIGEDTSEISDWIHKTKRAINTKLWNKEKSLYGDYDLKNNKLILKDTIANYSPLFAGIVPSDRINFLLKNLFSTKKYTPKNGYPFCSVSMSEKDFDPVRYWRGPVWINMNWLIYRGLKNYNFYKKAEELKDKTLELVSRSGFYEYFDPFIGKGYGANNFSWTASLVIDFIKS
ncbi:MAG: hypothetical protein DRP89_08560 [Candidatus Neomarinimicrobiota bacterium]|nr:MAG: hypothetical protein DRP89_08560 [Candidatus Neomarinimicrobiota bacterium]